MNDVAVKRCSSWPCWCSEERRIQHWHRNRSRWVVDGLNVMPIQLTVIPDPMPRAAIYGASGW